MYTGRCVHVVCVVCTCTYVCMWYEGRRMNGRWETLQKSQDDFFKKVHLFTNDITRIQ